MSGKEREIDLDMEPQVIFEDKNIIAINKPAGWIVNEAQTTVGQKVLQNWLADKDYPLAKSKEFRSGIVHRLDKETSGILLVAKNKETFENLQKQFKERKIKKTYLALVHGKVVLDSGEINAPVGRLPWRRDRFGVLPGGREAITKYKALVFYMLHSTYYTLLELYPQTGRTHQIRIHLKYIGHPIVADEFYAGRKTARNDRLWCPRLFLQAKSIEYQDLKKLEYHKVEIDLSLDLQDALDKLLEEKI